MTTTFLPLPTFSWPFFSCVYLWASTARRHQKSAKKQGLDELYLCHWIQITICKPIGSTESQADPTHLLALNYRTLLLIQENFSAFSTKTLTTVILLGAYYSQHAWYCSARYFIFCQSSIFSKVPKFCDTHTENVFKAFTDGLLSSDNEDVSLGT